MHGERVKKTLENTCVEKYSWLVDQLVQIISQHSLKMSYQVMIPSWEDIKGPLFLDLKSCNDTISAGTLSDDSRAAYHDQEKLQYKLTDGIILLPNNARFCVAHRLQDQLKSMQQEFLKASVYSPYLLPCDFHISWPVKKAVESHKAICSYCMTLCRGFWFGNNV